MMMRRAAMKLVGALALLVGVGVSEDANAAEVIKIGTLAPGASPWGQVFKVWADAVSKKSDGKLELWVATQAPEMARRAAADAVGIAERDVVLYPMPAGGSFTPC